MKELLKEILIWISNKNYEYKSTRTYTQMVDDFIKEKDIKLKK